MLKQNTGSEPATSEIQKSPSRTIFRENALWAVPLTTVVGLLAVEEYRIENVSRDLKEIRVKLEAGTVAAKVSDDYLQATALTLDTLSERFDRLVNQNEDLYCDLSNLNNTLYAFKDKYDQLEEHRQSELNHLSADNLHGIELAGQAIALLQADLYKLESSISEQLISAETILAQVTKNSLHDENKIADIETRIKRSAPDELWNDMVGPTVQITGDSTVGSGVMLKSYLNPTGKGYITPILTAWHVVRDIVGSLDQIDSPIPVKIYPGPDETTKFERAHVVAYDLNFDLALLRLDSQEQQAHGAILASESRCKNIKTFDPVYAVGCPLGNDPIPTVGEIAAPNDKINGAHYFMLSAPTYIGNSGGGVYDARTHELIGILSKIYTHGAARSTIVPHMGLATPMSVVYEWLDHVECRYLVRGSEKAESVNVTPASSPKEDRFR